MAERSLSKIDKNYSAFDFYLLIFILRSENKIENTCCLCKSNLRDNKLISISEPIFKEKNRARAGRRVDTSRIHML